MFLKGDDAHGAFLLFVMTGAPRIAPRPATDFGYWGMLRRDIEALKRRRAASSAG
jgi:hypothetical protein